MDVANVNDPFAFLCLSLNSVLLGSDMVMSFLSASQGHGRHLINAGSTVNGGK